MSLPSSLDKPRLCSLRKWHDFAGYGFNLHAEKGKVGQYIGKVDPHSPSDVGGLKANDVVIEVNGINVENFTHQQVVERVKAIPDRVSLFVCTIETYKYCKDNDIRLASNLSFVVNCETPPNRSSEEISKNNVETNNHNRSSTPEQEVVAAVEAALVQSDVESEPQVDDHDHDDHPVHLRAENSLRDSHFDQDVVEDEPGPQFAVKGDQEDDYESEPPRRSQSPEEKRSESPPPPVIQQRYEPEPVRTPEPEIKRTSEPVQKPTQVAAVHASPANSNNRNSKSDPVGNLSLEEMKARLGHNKRTEVKMKQNSFAEKYQVFQAL